MSDQLGANLKADLVGTTEMYFNICASEGGNLPHKKYTITLVQRTGSMAVDVRRKFGDGLPTITTRETFRAKNFSRKPHTTSC